MNDETLLDLAVDLGHELAMSGAETYRIEETVIRVLGAYGIDAQVFSIPNCLIVSITGSDGRSVTRMRRVGPHGNDLDAVEKFSGLSRAICNRRPAPAEARQWFRTVQAQRLYYGAPVLYLGNFLSAAGFALFFGGGLADSLCAGVCGMLVAFVNAGLDRRRANPFIRTIASSFLMAMLAYGFGAAGLAPSPDAVTIGALMLLVPGLLFTNAMRDILYGDINSGTNRVVQVLLAAMALVLGTGSAWSFATILWGVPQSAADIDYPLLAQCLFALVSCIGFAILFNIHGPGGLLCALGGMLAWAVYGICLELGCTDITAYFWSGLFSSVYSEIMARIRKYPAISYLVVSLFPMIPGAGVYYTMNYAVLGHMERFASQGMHTAAIAGILAVGILLGSTLFRMHADWKARAASK